MAELAFVTDQRIFGGGESNLLRLAMSLSSMHSTTVIAPDGRLLEEAARAGLRTSRLPGSLSRWVKGVPISFNDRLLRIADQFDIVHAYSLHVLPGLFGHPRLLWTVHGPWEKPWGLRASTAARHLQRVIAVSRDVADHCAFPEPMKLTIHLGGVTRDACVQRQPTGVRDHLRVGVLARLQPIKGQDLAIAGMVRLASSSPQQRFQLVLAGDADPTSKADLAYAAGLRDVVVRARIEVPNLEILMPGFISDTATFLNQLDLLLVPSRYESFSMVTVEALACGVPVVVPDCGGPAEIVDSMAVGLRFRPGDAADISAKLSDAFASERFDPAVMVERAKDFSIERQRDRHLAIYSELLA